MYVNNDGIREMNLADKCYVEEFIVKNPGLCLYDISKSLSTYFYGYEIGYLIGLLVKENHVKESSGRFHAIGDNNEN